MLLVSFNRAFYMAAGSELIAAIHAVPIYHQLESTHFILV
jgi:hypothetical protein